MQLPRSRQKSSLGCASGAGAGGIPAVGCVCCNRHAHDQRRNKNKNKKNAVGSRRASPGVGWRPFAFSPDPGRPGGACQDSLFFGRDIRGESGSQSVKFDPESLDVCF